MKVIVVIGIICYWISYAIVSGTIEAYLWTLNARYSVSRERNKDIHGMFLIQRFIVWVLSITIFAFVVKDTYGTIAFAVALAFMFPFWHLGSMYWKRQRLDMSYPLGFASDPSDTSESRINITFASRSLLFLSSIIILTVIFLFKI